MCLFFSMKVFRNKNFLKLELSSHNALDNLANTLKKYKMAFVTQTTMKPMQQNNCYGIYMSSASHF